MTMIAMNGNCRPIMAPSAVVGSPVTAPSTVTGVPSAPKATGAVLKMRTNATASSGGKPTKMRSEAVTATGAPKPATLEYTSRLIGEADVPDQSLTIDPTGGRSTTRSRRERPLAPDADLRRIRPGEGVLVYGHLPPAKVRLRPLD